LHIAVQTSGWEGVSLDKLMPHSESAETDPCSTCDGTHLTVSIRMPFEGQAAERSFDLFLTGAGAL
jgi:hypothetical protein